MDREKYIEQQMGKYQGSFYEYPKGSGQYNYAFYYNKYGDDSSKKRTHFKVASEDDAIIKRSAFLGKVYDAAVEAMHDPAASVMMSPVLVNAASPMLGMQMPVKNGMKQATLGEVAQEYLDSRRNDAGLGVSGFSDIQNNVKHVLKSYVSQKQITEVTHGDFQDFLNTFVQDGRVYSEKSIKGYKQTFVNIMKYASRHKYVAYEDVEDVTSDIHIPKNAGKYDKNTATIGYEELGKILACFNKESTSKVKNNSSNSENSGALYYYVVRIMLLTGMRPQEIFCLKKSNLLKDDHIIMVEGALKKTEKQNGASRYFEEGTTKTDASVRAVPAIDVVFDYFNALENLQGKTGARQKAMDEYEGVYKDYAIVNKAGCPVNPHTFTENLTKFIRRRSDLHFYPYQLRHAFTTNMDMENADEMDVERAAGHAMGVNDVKRSLGKTLHDVGNLHYRAKNYSYVGRMLPAIERMQEKMEIAYVNALNEENIERKF